MKKIKERGWEEMGEGDLSAYVCDMDVFIT